MIDRYPSCMKKPLKSKRAKYVIKITMGIVVLVTALSARAPAYEKPLLTITLGASTNTNIFNNALEIDDKLTDLSFYAVQPWQLDKNTWLLPEYTYRHDWKTENTLLNVELSQYAIRCRRRLVSDVTILLGYALQNYKIYTANGGNFAVEKKFADENLMKVDYSLFRRRFNNPGQNGTNQVLKLSYKFPINPFLAAVPFYSYEKNTAANAPTFDYTGHTAGIRYEWQTKKKISFTTSYDYRMRNYDTPFLFKGMTSTKREGRSQLQLAAHYRASDKVVIIVNYFYIKSDASSENFAYVKDRRSKSHIFSFAVSYKPLAKKSRPLKDHNEDDLTKEEEK